MPITKDTKQVELQMDALTETIRQLHEVSSRIDERIKHLIEKQTAMAEKLEKSATLISEGHTRVAILENSNLTKTKEEVDEIDKKLAILERQFNNGICSDMESVKAKVHALELSNEHNTSFRTKGEVRLQWGVDMVWKIVQIVGAGFLAYYLSKK